MDNLFPFTLQAIQTSNKSSVEELLRASPALLDESAFVSPALDFL